MMIERIIHIDQQLFLFLNSLNSPFFDRLMHIISGKLIWTPLYLALLIYLGFKYRKKFYLVLLFIIVAVLMSDQFSVQFFKNVFHRLRPCHEPALKDIVHLVNGECGGLYGFVSSHASNSFNVALLSLMFIKRRWYTICIILWASVIGYSRIYLGVHYPADVFCGAILGSLVGWGVYKLYMMTDNVLYRSRVD